jgi:hypothetical protein
MRVTDRKDISFEEAPEESNSMDVDVSLHERISSPKS